MYVCEHDLSVCMVAVYVVFGYVCECFHSGCVAKAFALAADPRLRKRTALHSIQVCLCVCMYVCVSMTYL
jgi:hypothetical protein